MMKQASYISMLSDSCFKYLFKQEEFRPFFEDIIKYITGIDIKGYHLVDNELNIGNNKRKDYRLDILLEKDNHLISIEMNRFLYPHTSTKNHAYLYRLAGSNYAKSENYKKKYTWQINFNNSRSEYGNIIKYEFCDKKYNLVIEDIKDYEIYLLNYKGIRYNGTNKSEMYLAMFTAESYEELEEIVGESKEGKRMYEELKKLGIDDKYDAYYDAEVIHRKELNTVRLEGQEEGYASGKAQGYMEVAKNLLHMNLPVEDVMKATGLSRKEVNKLAHRIN